MRTPYHDLDWKSIIKEKYYWKNVVIFSYDDVCFIKAKNEMEDTNMIIILYVKKA